MIWTVTNVTIGVSVGLLLALVLNTQGARAAADLPGAADPALGDAELHHRADLEGHVPPAVRRDQPGAADLRHASRVVLVRRSRSPRSSPRWRPTAGCRFPFMMVVSLGALQSIPADLYEAARVDGREPLAAVHAPSPCRRCKPALMPAVILSVVWTFNMFNIIYLVTAGEPGGSTEILITQAYKFAFQQYQYGYAAAYATIIFVHPAGLRHHPEPRDAGHGGALMASSRPRGEDPALAPPRIPGGDGDLRRLPGALGPHHRLLREAEPGDRRPAGGPDRARPRCGRSCRGRRAFAFSNFVSVMTDQPFARWLLNSAIVAIGDDHRRGGAVPAPRPTPSRRFRFPGRRFGMMSFLVSQMFPGTLTLIPLYIIIVQWLGLGSTLTGLVLVYATTSIPVLRLDAEGLLRHHPQGARGGGADRRRVGRRRFS